MQTPDNVKVGDMFRVIGIGSYWGNCATWDIVSIKSDDSDWFPMLCNISRGWEEACVAWHYLGPYQEQTKEPTPEKIAVHTPTQESYDIFLEEDKKELLETVEMLASKSQPLSSIKKPMNALQTLRNKIFFTDKLGEKTNKIIEEAQELCKWYDSTANRASRAARKITGLIDALEGAYDSQDIKAYGDCKDKLEQVLAWIKKDPESLTLSQLGKKEVKKEEKYDASI